MKFDFYNFPKKEDTKDNVLIWNVFTIDMNSDEVEVCNLLTKNWYMWNEIRDILKKNKNITIDEFADKVRSALMYMYWSRFEFESVITSFPPYVDEDAIKELNEEYQKRIERYGKFYQTQVNLKTGVKIDVYTQVALNWTAFIQYLWNNKEKIYKPRKPKVGE